MVAASIYKIESVACFLCHVECVSRVYDCVSLFVSVCVCKCVHVVCVIVCVWEGASMSV